MRGHHGCECGPFGRHCQDMGRFGPFGPTFGGFGWGRGHHGSPKFGHHCTPGQGRQGPGSFKPGRPWHHYVSGPCSGEDLDNCCQVGAFKRGPCRRERGPHGTSGCAEFEHNEGKRYGPPPPYCGRRHGHNRERSPHGCQDRGERPHGRHKHCHGPPNYAPEPHETGDRHHSHQVPCQRPQGHGSRHCSRRDHSRERRPGGPHGGCEPFGPDFGHFGPHRRPFGPWNRQGPYERYGRRQNYSDEESGNETERRGRKNKPCCRKNKDLNRDETVLVQRIVVDNVPRCNSV